MLTAIVPPGAGAAILGPGADRPPDLHRCAQVSAAQVSERIQVVLEAAGFGDFQITGTRVAGQAGARLDCARHDSGRTWAVREYFVIRGDVRFVLGCGSFAAKEDDSLFTAMAERFEILSPA